MGKSTFDQTIYNSTASGHNGFGGFNAPPNKTMMQSAIRIEHSPSMNIIYAKDPRDSKHIHKKT